MKLDFRNEDGIGIIKISERLDASNVSTLKSSFKEYLKDVHNFVVDLSELDFIDSTGLGAIVACLKYASEAGGDLKIAGLSNKARMLFEITRAYKMFDVFDDFESAKADF